jgi:hypothetical protein
MPALLVPVVKETNMKGIPTGGGDIDSDFKANECLMRTAYTTYSRKDHWYQEVVLRFVLPTLDYCTLQRHTACIYRPKTPISHALNSLLS